MKWLSDTTIDHLRELAELPDLEGTRYRVERELGRGGMGVVYLAEDTTLKREVALKVLNTTLLSPAMVQRMLREATVIACLEHPGIVPVHDAGTLLDGRVFYVMKLVRGKSLAEDLQSGHSLQDRLRIFLKACEAVAFAHANGVIHRDLKPENIMLGPFGEVLVMDWGTAKIIKQAASQTDEARAVVPPSENVTDHGLVMGTPAYMSPEQASGLDQLDERTDVYSLGAVLNVLVDARGLLESSTLIARDPTASHRAASGRSNEKTPKPLLAICNRAMAKDPAARYQSVKELAADISRYLDGERVSAYKENIFERLERWILRHRFLVLLVLAYLLMRVLFLFVQWD